VRKPGTDEAGNCAKRRESRIARQTGPEWCVGAVTGLTVADCGLPYSVLAAGGSGISRSIDMKAFRGFLMLCGISLAAGAQADDNLWLGVKAGTLGLGVEATWRPLPWFDLRGGFNAFDYDDDGSQAGINYEAELRLQSYHATANFRFPMSPFRLSAGLVGNDNELALVSRETGTIDVGATTFAADDVGTLQSLTSFDSTAPYLGIGFDFGLFGKVGMNLDLGVLFQGDPKVTLTSSGALADDPAFQQALEEERLQLRDDLDKLKLYPVASLGFNVQFL
jgi:hypothetical protein